MEKGSKANNKNRNHNLEKINNSKNSGEKNQSDSQKYTSKQVESQQSQHGEGVQHSSTDAKNQDVLPAQVNREVLKISETTHDKFRKREVCSNWGKYEIPKEEDEFKGANFKELKNAPISIGGHFRFKSEKRWDVNVNQQFGEYFKLNIKMLADGLSTIPFHIRNNIPTNIFSSDEVNKMIAEADINSQRYKESLISNTPYVEETTAINQKIMSVLNAPSSSVQVENSDTTFRDAGEKCTVIHSDLNNTHLEKNIPSENNADAAHSHTLNSVPIALNEGDQTLQHLSPEDDLDELLKLKSPSEEVANVPSPISEDQIMVEEPILSNPNVIQSDQNVLENWLDDLLI